MGRERGWELSHWWISVTIFFSCLPRGRPDYSPVPQWKKLGIIALCAVPVFDFFLIPTSCQRVPSCNLCIRWSINEPNLCRFSIIWSFVVDNVASKQCKLVLRWFSLSCRSSTKRGIGFFCLSTFFGLIVNLVGFCYFIFNVRVRGSIDNDADDHRSKREREKYNETV